MPQDLLVRKCINVMVGITRSKVIFTFSKCSISALPAGSYLHHFMCMSNDWRLQQTSVWLTKTKAGLLKRMFPVSTGFAGVTWKHSLIH